MLELATRWHVSQNNNRSRVSTYRACLSTSFLAFFDSVRSRVKDAQASSSGRDASLNIPSSSSLNAYTFDQLFEFRPSTKYTYVVQSILFGSTVIIQLLDQCDLKFGVCQVVSGLVKLVRFLSSLDQLRSGLA